MLCLQGFQFLPEGIDGFAKLTVEVIRMSNCPLNPLVLPYPAFFEFFAESVDRVFEGTVFVVGC